MSETIELSLPAMYADHHVQRVRQALLSLAGVERVMASAADRRVEVQYGTPVSSAAAIREALTALGYPEGEVQTVEEILTSNRTAWQRSPIRFSRTHPLDVQASGDFRRY